ncbi:conserved hypothetical protein, partial [Ixodes scapularis]
STDPLRPSSFRSLQRAPAGVPASLHPPLPPLLPRTPSPHSAPPSPQTPSQGLPQSLERNRQLPISPPRPHTSSLRDTSQFPAAVPSAPLPMIPTPVSIDAPYAGTQRQGVFTLTAILKSGPAAQDDLTSHTKALLHPEPSTPAARPAPTREAAALSRKSKSADHFAALPETLSIPPEC